MKEDFVHEMAPVLMDPIVAIRIVLKEEMIFAAVTDRPIRIVAPEGRWLEMINGTVGILFNPLASLSYRSLGLFHHFPMVLVSLSIRWLLRWSLSNCQAPCQQDRKCC